MDSQTSKQLQIKDLQKQVDKLIQQYVEDKIKLDTYKRQYEQVLLEFYGGDKKAYSQSFRKISKRMAFNRSKVKKLSEEIIWKIASFKEYDARILKSFKLELKDGFYKITGSPVHIRKSNSLLTEKTKVYKVELDDTQKPFSFVIEKKSDLKARLFELANELDLYEFNNFYNIFLNKLDKSEEEKKVTKEPKIKVKEKIPTPITPDPIK